MQKYSSSAASCPRAPRRCAVYQCTVLYYALQEGQEMTVSMENLASFLTPLTIVKKTFDSPEVSFRDC